MTDAIRAHLIAGEIVQSVCELPDRTSPDDWPEAMLVTRDELHAIIVAALATPAESDALRAQPDDWEAAALEIAADFPMIAKALNFPADEVPDGAAIVAKIAALRATLGKLMDALEIVQSVGVLVPESYCPGLFSALDTCRAALSDAKEAGHE